MTIDEAQAILQQADKHMAAAGELAQRVLAELPNKPDTHTLRSHARYVTSGVTYQKPEDRTPILRVVRDGQ